MPDDGAAHAYRSHALAGSPARRLQDEAAALLASGAVPRCPHQGQPVVWYFPAGMLACAVCADAFLASAGREEACHLCGGPAAAVAAWVAGDVPCVAGLCEQCRTAGVVPLAPN